MESDQAHPSLSDTVDAIFAACQLRYGKAYFMARWEGQTVRAVKADWCRVLDGLERNQRAVRFALANLPDAPPMAHEFKRIANAVPNNVVPALEHAYRPSEEGLQLIAEQLASLSNTQGKPSPMSVAKGLRDREMAGEKLSVGQKDFWRRVLAPGLALKPKPGNERPSA